MADQEHDRERDFCLFEYSSCLQPFKYEAQTALFKDPVRTAQ